ncbi:type II and III secretion system protein family protein [Ramlibacter sp. WS9]|uniref:type II and III secretion system protein family protein n=1 Tax=Ramlibacter sp. WS9 TaxID=1882741 RepID=UPI00114323B3|nr:type II and III secretion system protein family protein [Ramlibacter sp. WS9]ROZ76630.1 type II and III secretion system protein family protein [Ramlibacter sp. WS9]
MHSATTKAALAAALVIATAPAFAQAQQAQQAQQTPPARSGSAPIASSAPAGRPCSTVTVDPPTYLTLGKSRVVRLDFPATRIVVGGSSGSRAGRPVNLTPTPGQPGQAAPQGMPGAGSGGASTDGVADTEITLLGPNELFFLGRKPGSMNVVLQGSDGRCVVKDIVVTIDPEALQGQLAALMPEESGVRVRGADNSLVLTGTVSDAVKLDQILTVAAAYGDSKKLVNLLRVTAPQQVMLEVQIAEVSKTLLDKLGASVNARRNASSGLNTYSLISSFLSGGGGLLQALRIGTGSITIDAQKDDGLVRVLAEPNIMAISGQSASFLSGGKIFIPVAQSPNNALGSGGTTITLEEKEFGVGLKFTPTVLDGRINLKVVSEVSELSQTGTPFSTINGVTAILPSLSTRRIDTTVQLGDGQSFVVAGLIKNNVTEALKRVPGLGEVPVMGALFRSTEFQTDQTELMFVVTPRLVKPLTAAVMLPTDNHSVPSRGDVMFMGRSEGATPPARPAGAANETMPVPTVTVVVPASATPVQAPVEPPANLVPTASTSAVSTSVVEAAPLLPVSGRQ